MSLHLGIVWKADETTIKILLSKQPSQSHNQHYGKREQYIAPYSSVTNNIQLLEFEDSYNTVEILEISFSNSVHTISPFNKKKAIFDLTQRTI